MKISELLDEQQVITGLKAESKTHLIDQVIALLEPRLEPTMLKQVKKAVHEREVVMSTGVGKGLAIPHAKVDGLQQNFAAFALLDKPIEYNALDGNPVNMVFLIIGPQSQNSLHIKILSRISRLMNNESFRDKLNSLPDSKSIIDAFEEEESSYFAI
jgi:fructose-specific phosphotransferase system IIA component